MITAEKERRLEFAEALRSGKYKQCKHVLKRDTESAITHCVWGVGCEIYHNHNPNTTEWIDYSVADRKFEQWFRTDNGDVYNTKPPIEVQEFFGLSDSAVRILMALNDGIVQRDFRYLANFIESYVEGVSEEEAISQEFK